MSNPIKFLHNLKQKPSSTYEEGFTLLELLIVIIVIGILTAIAIPLFSNQQKASIGSGLKNDVRNTNINLITYLAKNPTADYTDINQRAKGVGEPERPASEIANPTINNNYKIVITHPDTTISVFGSSWKSYTIRAWNTTLDPAASLALSGEYDVYYRSTTGATTIGE